MTLWLDVESRSRCDLKAHGVYNYSQDALVALLTRYRNETPLGHQPHMIAHEVDAALTAAQGDGK